MFGHDFSPFSDASLPSQEEKESSQVSPQQHIQLQNPQCIDDLWNLLDRSVSVDHLESFRDRDKQQLSLADACSLHAPLLGVKKGWEKHFGSRSYGVGPWQAVHIWCAKICGMDTTAAYAVKDRDLRGFKALLEKITSQVTGLVNHRPQGTEKEQWREEYLKSSHNTENGLFSFLRATSTTMQTTMAPMGSIHVVT